jgi:hypothetical protein
MLTVWKNADTDIPVVKESHDGVHEGAMTSLLYD